MSVISVLKPLMVGTVTFIPAFSFGSCSFSDVFSCSCNLVAKDPITDEGVEEFIHDRSFSLLGSGTVGGTRYMSWGTGWIISDATPGDFTDYKYYIATNWHVVLGHQQTQSSTSNFHMYFGDNTQSSGLTVLTDFTQFESYTLEDESNFYYTNRLNAIDFYVAKADFSTAEGSTKTKLNKLNALQQEKGYITQFADPITESTQYMTSTMYTAGFPVKNKYYATWETHQFSPSKVNMKYYGKDTKPHQINSESYTTHKDTSPQYVIQDNVGTSWMTAGASGSMLLGKFDDTYKVCGIYWGGWTNSSKSDFYPSYSIFRSSDKDFIEDYI